ncbi:MAG: PcfJ domain-containing protein [Blautia obeum]|nr:PcfJ domain-containing protein [Blautia obeum]
MNKAQLLKMKDLMADDEMIRIAKKEKKQKANPAYWYSPERYQHGKFLRACVIDGILKVSVFLTEYLRFGGMEPAYNVYIDKEKEDFITYDFMYQKWSNAKLDRLGWPEYAESREVFCTVETTKCIQEYLHADTAPYEAILFYQMHIREKRLDKKHKKETDKWKKRMEQIPPLPKDWERWLNKVGITEHFIFYEYDRKGAKQGYCTWCEKMVPVVEPRHNKKGRCRCCGHKIQFKAVGKASEVRSKEETAYLIQHCREGFVVREFRAWAVYPQKYYTKPFRYSFEQRRIIYDKELNGTEFYYGNYKRRENTWIEGNLRAKTFYYYAGNEPYYSGKIYGRTIPSLDKQELRYTGLREIMKSMEFISPKHYFAAVKEMPYLEKIIKAGLFRLAKELLNGSEYLEFKDKKELGKSLGIDRFRLRRLREKKGGVLYLEWLQQEKTNGRVIDDSVIRWLEERHIKPKDLRFISDRMSEQQVKNYLERQMKQIDMDVKEILSLWKDYLTMARRVHMNVNDPIVYRAKDLKKRHDEMVQRVEDKNLVLRAGDIAESFPKVDAICEELKEKYEYEGKDYRIIAPKGIEDILNEGNALHHCVDKNDNYFERINTRESYILFLRRTEKPDKAYYTLEVEPDGTVRQKRTEFNRQHSDIEQAERFLRKWQKQLQKKLTKIDFELAMHSKKLRKQELDEMRDKKIKINGGDYAGRLLADVLEADVLEMQDGKELAA